jgi:hypothetical protein
MADYTYKVTDLGRGSGHASPELIAGRIEQLGGTIIPHNKLRFECTLSDARKIITEVGRLGGVSCEKIGERQDRDMQGRACSVGVFKVIREPAKSDYDQERNLMAAIIR